MNKSYIIIAAILSFLTNCEIEELKPTEKKSLNPLMSDEEFKKLTEHAKNRNSTPKQEFNYPKEINKLSALFRVEVQPQMNKVFHYKIKKETQECIIDLGYYISETEASNTRTPITAEINFYNPDNSNLRNLKFDSLNKKPQRSTLTLNQLGEYTFVVSNNSRYFIIVDLVLAMTNCHMIPHKMHKEDLIVFQNRLETTFMDQSFVINDNLSTRYTMKEILLKNIEATHVKLYYGTLLESLVIVILSVVQICYMKRILENKQVI